MISGSVSSPTRFFAWWLGELRACVPGVLSRLIFGADERVFVDLGVEDAGFHVLRKGGSRELGRVTLGQGDRTIRRAAQKLLVKGRAENAPVTLRLPEGQVLQPQIEFPIDAAENLREVVALEMDRHTPFAASDVLFDLHVAGTDAELQRLKVDLLVARRRDVEAAVARARAMGLSVDVIAGPGEGQSWAGFNLMPPDQRPRPNPVLGYLVTMMALVCLGLAGYAGWQWIDRKERALAGFEARVAELRATTGEAGRLEASVEHLRALSSYLLDKKRSQAQMVAILDEITRRLPDQTWLISYSDQDGRIDLAGYSDDPSNLLRVLEQSDLFSEVQFASPVTMDGRVGEERFSIRMTAARGGEGQ